MVVDTTNPRFGPGLHDVYDLGERTSREVVAALVPGARVVKAFNHQPIPPLAGHGRLLTVAEARALLAATRPAGARGTAAPAPRS